MLLLAAFISKHCHIFGIFVFLDLQTKHKLSCKDKINQPYNLPLISLWEFERQKEVKIISLFYCSFQHISFTYTHLSILNMTCRELSILQHFVLDGSRNTVPKHLWQLWHPVRHVGYSFTASRLAIDDQSWGTFFCLHLKYYWKSLNAAEVQDDAMHSSLMAPGDRINHKPSVWKSQLMS